MLDAASLWSFLGIAVLLGLTPGPDNLFVLMQSAQRGWQVGLYVVLGLCLGLVVHTAAGGWPDEATRMRVWKHVAHAHAENLLIFTNQQAQPSQHERKRKGICKHAPGQMAQVAKKTDAAKHDKHPTLN